MRQFGSKTVSKAHQRTALGQLLIMRASLDGVDAGSLARSYGLPLPEIEQMIAGERRRRERAA